MAGDSHQAQINRGNQGPPHEVVSLLAAALLTMVLDGSPEGGEDRAIPLISGSQPAPLCPDGGAEKPGPMHEEGKG
jgi:hypothetical protein